MGWGLRLTQALPPTFATRPLSEDLGGAPQGHQIEHTNLGAPCANTQREGPADLKIQFPKQGFQIPWVPPSLGPRPEPGTRCSDPSSWSPGKVGSKTDSGQALSLKLQSQAQPTRGTVFWEGEARQELCQLTAPPTVQITEGLSSCRQCVFTEWPGDCPHVARNRGSQPHPVPRQLQVLAWGVDLRI